MKKYLAFILITSLVLTSCKKEDSPTIAPPIDISEQNSNDDAAIQNFLQDNTFTDNGKVVALTEDEKKAGLKKPLTAYKPTKLPSGVVYLHYYEPIANPLVNKTDALSLQYIANMYISRPVNNKVILSNNLEFSSTIMGTGVARQDPYFYYTSPSKIPAGITASYFEIEGLQEAMVNFRSCKLEPVDDYKLQGLIIVPSRAAYARDDHYKNYNVNWNDRTLVFNFQIYKAEARK
jgi:major membrane immunogen (membrane-anchored lipoprotein)